jgi:hypothetical protein
VINILSQISNREKLWTLYNPNVVEAGGVTDAIVALFLFLELF